MNPDLYKSAKDGNLDNLKQSLDDLVGNNGLLPDQLTRSNNNLLHVLSQFGDFLECILEILGRVQNFKDKHSMLIMQNLQGETALIVASRNGCVKIVEALIDRAQSLHNENLESGFQTMEKMMRATDQQGDTALHKAVEIEHGEIVRLLVSSDPSFEHPVNNSNETPLYVAVRNGYHEIVNLILTNCSSPGYKGPEDKTALHAAVLDKCVDCASKLLRKNSTLAKQADESGWIPLHYAAYIRGSSFAVARVLLNADKSTAYITCEKDDNKTALHIAACCRANERIMEELLEHCPDCWDMVTNKFQNVLHLAATKSWSEKTIEYILKQRWATNLVNQKDGDGNMPLHLLVKYADRRFISKVIFLLKRHQVAIQGATNKEGFTPSDLLEKRKINVNEKLKIWGQLSEIGVKEGRGKLNISFVEESNETKERNEREMKGVVTSLTKFGEKQLIVATLIATVTFAAGFTLPGGYDGNKGSNQGMAVLVKKAAFKIFVVSNAIAVISSLLFVFLHFVAAVNWAWEQIAGGVEGEMRYVVFHTYAFWFLVIAKIGMVIAFIMGLYTVLDEGSLGLAISVCGLGCLALLFMLYNFRYLLQAFVGSYYLEWLILEGCRGIGRMAWKLAAKAFVCLPRDR